MATLETIYKNQLGRAPDAGGLAHYQAQIAGGRSIDDIRQEIANSPEAKSRGVGAYASSSGGGGGSSQQSQAAPAEPKYNRIVGQRGEVNFDGLPRGRGFSSLYASLGAAAKARGDLFQGRVRDGDLSLLEGYSFTGGQGKVLVDTIAYRGNDTNPDGTINIYKDAAPAQTTTTDTGTTNTTDTTDANTNTDTGTSNEVNNPYQDQIDDLIGQIGTISGQIGGYTDTINTLRGQIQTMQTDFGNQLKGIMDANTKALEDMSTQYQQQLLAQQQAQERARQQRELAAQTAAANQARAAQGQANLQLGSTPLRGIFGGLAGFKRRGKVKAAASNALSIGNVTPEKSPNKMLNV